MHSSLRQCVDLWVGISAGTLSRYRKLGLRDKIMVLLLAVSYAAVLVLIFAAGPSKVFQVMYDLSQRLRNMRFGWLILFSIMIVSSFPPVIGHSWAMSICGFAYGIKGIIIAAPGALIGSMVTFIVFRRFLQSRLKIWSHQNKKWQAMEHVIKTDGLKLIILVRLCPIPWVYSNTLFASIESVSLLQFFIATVCLFPKQFLIVFIGSEASLLSDGTRRDQMSTSAKVLDLFSIVLGILLTMGTGWYVWRTTERRIHAVELEGDLDGTTDDIEDASAPLLHEFSIDRVDDRIPSSHDYL